MEEKNKTWLSNDEILAIVRDERDRGYVLMEPLLEIFKKDLRRYYNEKKKKNKVWDTTLYNVHSAFLARLYVNYAQVSFDTFDNLYSDVISNINSVYLNDYEDQHEDTLKYQQLWDMLFFWVGIKAKIWWDWLEKKNKFQIVDPRTAIFDPDWDYYNWDYSFIWFTKNVSKNELKQLWYNVEDITKSEDINWPTELRREDLQSSWASSSYSTNKDNYYSEIYYHFTIIDWKSYKIVTANNRTLLLEIEELKPVFSWEKDKKRTVPFPFSFKLFRPVRWNPTGYRLFDLIRDVQDSKAIIANLRLDKSKAELYPMYLFNSRLIKNKTDLDFWFNKLISVNPMEWEPLDNAIRPMQKDFRTDNSYILDDSLDRQVQSSTSIGKIIEWSSTERREAATTNKLVQSNTDINIWLVEKTVSWWDKQDAMLWFRWYIENFKSWDEKKIKFYTWYWFLNKKLKKEDFLSIEDVKIYVKTSFEKEREDTANKIAFWQIFPLLQTLEVPKSSINFAYRQLFLSSWLKPQQVDIIIPKTPQEIIAEENIELLKMWEFVPVEDTYDPITHLVVLNSAWEWNNIEMYRRWLLDLYTIKWWSEWLNMPNEALTQNTWAQAMNQMWNTSNNLLNNK